ncbi:SAM-dependent methyltransferase [Skermania piniformis]|uniref:SAM-dependent methyltransferase n=1 Tax=Skermania pinensis TaxID=39122 RepID=A0ABX8S8A5_9ACTN|nr:SAM-dependent methyltransferase [Skermania piniformis]QXQ14094.1 SAM-dependent methyltransferase [Skermania piniformis]
MTDALSNPDESADDNPCPAAFDVPEQPAWAPEDIDPRIPSVARVYDYVVGGVHNFAVDRDIADRAASMWPEVPLILRENRAVLRRFVRFLAGEGIRQFLDIGSGIPTAGNVHEVLAVPAPDAKVVYVDIDPVAVMHSQAILDGNPNALAVHGDFTEIDAVLSDPAVNRMIDFTQPVAVLLAALLHFILDDADPAGSLARIRARMAPGSYLALTHFSDEGPPDKVAQFVDMSRETPNPLTLRSKQQIAAFLDGLQAVTPGLVYLPLWRPDSPDDVDENPERFSSFAGIGYRGR